MSFIYRTVLAGLVAVALAAPASAQQNVTQSDIQRLQDNVFLADRDISQLRSRDATRATQLDAELDELRDEVVYLKVKLRKERSLARTEYADVRDRIEDLRTRARGDATGRYSIPPAQTGSTASSGRTQTGTRGTTTSSTGAYAIPAGTEIDVRLQNALNSGTAQVEDRFEATTLVDLNVNGRVVIPAGSLMRGVVTAVEPGTRTNRTSRMTVSFDQVTVPRNG
jgi:TolA-binding protein